MHVAAASATATPVSYGHPSSITGVTYVVRRTLRRRARCHAVVWTSLRRPPRLAITTAPMTGTGKQLRVFNRPFINLKCIVYRDVTKVPGTGLKAPRSGDCSRGLTARRYAAFVNWTNGGLTETRRLAIWRPAVAGLTSGDRPAKITNGPIEGQQQSNAIPGVNRGTSRRSPTAIRLPPTAIGRQRWRPRGRRQRAPTAFAAMQADSSFPRRARRRSPRGQPEPHFPVPSGRTTAGPHSCPSQTHDPAQLRDDTAA